jgi:hypothetical protein
LVSATGAGLAPPPNRLLSQAQKPPPAVTGCITGVAGEGEGAGAAAAAGSSAVTAGSARARAGVAVGEVRAVRLSALKSWAMR